MTGYSGSPRSQRRVIYRRNLPGGGFVNIEAEGSAPPDQLQRAVVTVERRADPARRDGHNPPVVAMAEGPSSQGIFRQLLEIAADNIAIARALLRSQQDGRPKF
ncbi:MAG TPA: hypothetical protein VJ717_12095 [Gemmatimonadaceae bacterium]|nr:hypothetical protein [Gemmatimonadaceae bacterium]